MKKIKRQKKGREGIAYLLRLRCNADTEREGEKESETVRETDRYIWFDKHSFSLRNIYSSEFLILL